MLTIRQTYNKSHIQFHIQHLTLPSMYMYIGENISSWKTLGLAILASDTRYKCS